MIQQNLSQLSPRDQLEEADRQKHYRPLLEKENTLNQ